jgi:REP element-mobilizing transposase RayT
MTYHPKKHSRRSIRLPGYDYALPGFYFVTICVRGGECLLGQVIDSEMRLNEWGLVAHDFWSQVPGHFPSVSIDASIVMPNHMHAVVAIQESAAFARDDEKGEETSPLQDTGEGSGGVGAECMDDAVGRGEVPAPGENIGEPGTHVVPAPTGQIKKPSLGQIVAYYKHETTRQINELRDMPGVPFWQRNYWEHIIRDDDSLDRIREYIRDNPARWDDDQMHPDAPPNPFNQWPPL